MNFDDLLSVVNGKLEFKTNIQSEIASITFGTADTEVKIPHGLGRVPTGYLLIGSAGIPSELYDGDTKNTTAFIYLKNVTANAVTKILISSCKMRRGTLGSIFGKFRKFHLIPKF